MAPFSRVGASAKPGAIHLDTDRAISGDSLPPFSQALRSVLKEFPVKRLARELGIPAGIIYGWLKGKKPRQSNVGYIHRIESFFGIERGELALLAGFSGGRRVPTTVGEATDVTYRENLGERTSQRYFFKPELDSPLRQQWHDFLRYKTDWQPALNRSEAAVWRTAPFEFRRETPACWAQYLDGVEVPSARFAWTKTAAYLGWLCMPEDEGGGGIAPDHLHTLAWFAVRDRVESYVRWMIRRNGNKYTGSVFEFFSLLMSVLRVGSGYLQQQPELLATLPETYADANWDEMCRSTYSLVKGLATRYRKARRQTRDPKEPIRHILDLENPLEVVVDMVQRMRIEKWPRESEQVR